MKHKNLLRIMTMLLFMAVLVCMNPFTAEASSKKEKAVKAYNKMLSESSFKVKTDAMSGNKKITVKYKTINCSFAVAYIDKDSIPELIVKNHNDTYHLIGHGAIFTYKNGKVKQVAPLQLDSSLKYYKKKGVIIDNYTGMGYSCNYYKKISNGKAKQFAQTEKNVGNPGSRKTRYFDANREKISKSTFDKMLKEYVKSSKPVKANFLENTAANREKHLK